MNSELEMVLALCISSALGLIGGLAQLGERLVCNQEVAGSIPVFSTIIRWSVIIFLWLEFCFCFLTKN